MPLISPLRRVVRRPAQVMAGVVCILLVVVAVLVWQVAVQGLRISVQDSTEASNRTLTRVFVNENWEAVKPLLPPPGSGAEAAKANPNIAAIDQMVRRFSSYTDVLKVKIYDRGGITVYSSDRSQIGEDKARNAGFQAAARGQVASELTHRGAFGAFDGEMYDRNLVSTYVPVRVGDRIEAVLEIYADRTASIEFINRELRGLALWCIPWALAALLLVAAVAWWLHRAQSNLLQAVDDAEARARRVDASAAARQADAGGHFARLPGAFEGLHAMLVRASPSGQTPGLAAANAITPAEWRDLFERFIQIERWARTCRDLRWLTETGAQTDVVTGPEPGHESLDLSAVADDVLAAALPMAEWRGWQIAGFRHPAVLGSARADRARIAALLANMIGASIDTAIPSGSQGHLQCKLIRVGEGLHIDVVDDGVGLPQDQLDRCFKEWDLNRRLPEADGNGLVIWRLLVARALVQQAGGRFDARGTPGHGNRWSADLPLARVEALA